MSQALDKMKALTRKGNDGKTDLLLRFFESSFFDEWIALLYLYQNTAAGVQDYLCNKLHELPQKGFERFLLQFVLLAVSRPGSALEKVLTDLCSKSFRIAVKVYWLLFAVVQDNPKSKHVAELKDRCEEAALKGDWEVPFLQTSLDPISPRFLSPPVSPAAALTASYHNQHRFRRSLETNLRDSASGRLSQLPEALRHLADLAPLPNPPPPIPEGSAVAGSPPPPATPLFARLSETLLAKAAAASNAAAAAAAAASAAATAEKASDASDAEPLPVLVEGSAWSSSFKERYRRLKQELGEGEGVTALLAKSKSIGGGAVVSAVADDDSSSASGAKGSGGGENEGNAAAAAAAAVAAAAPYGSAALDAITRIRHDTYGATLDFVDTLCEASSSLMRLPQEERHRALRHGLDTINKEIETASQHDVVVWWPMCENNERVLRLCAKEAVLLNSREKAPFMLFVEVLSNPDTIGSSGCSNEREGDGGKDPGIGAGRAGDTLQPVKASATAAGTPYADSARSLIGSSQHSRGPSNDSVTDSAFTGPAPEPHPESPSTPQAVASAAAAAGPAAPGSHANDSPSLTPSPAPPPQHATAAADASSLSGVLRTPSAVADSSSAGAEPPSVSLQPPLPPPTLPSSAPPELPSAAKAKRETTPSRVSPFARMTSPLSKSTSHNGPESAGAAGAADGKESKLASKLRVLKPHALQLASGSEPLPQQRSSGAAALKQHASEQQFSAIHKQLDWSYSNQQIQELMHPAGSSSEQASAAQEAPQPSFSRRMDQAMASLRGDAPLIKLHIRVLEDHSGLQPTRSAPAAAEGTAAAADHREDTGVASAAAAAAATAASSPPGRAPWLLNKLGWCRSKADVDGGADLDGWTQSPFPRPAKHAARNVVSVRLEVAGGVNLSILSPHRKSRRVPSHEAIDIMAGKFKVHQIPPPLTMGPPLTMPVPEEESAEAGGVPAPIMCASPVLNGPNGPTAGGAPWLEDDAAAEPPAVAVRHPDEASSSPERERQSTAAAAAAADAIASTVSEAEVADAFPGFLMPSSSTRVPLTIADSHPSALPLAGSALEAATAAATATPPSTSAPTAIPAGLAPLSAARPTVSDAAKASAAAASSSGSSKAKDTAADKRQREANAVYGERWQHKVARIRRESPHGQRPGWALRCVIVKSGDDCRQEQLAIQLIRTFHEIFSEASLPLWVRPYEVLTTSNRTALIEMIPDSLSIHTIKHRSPPGTSLSEHFFAKFGRRSAACIQAQRNFTESMAAYSIICYLLQIKDRHNGNIMLDDEGHIVHIDFDFMLSNAPGGINFESPPFKLTREYLEVMDSNAEGKASELFDYFKVLCIQAFLAARKHHDRILYLVKMMSKSGFACFKGGDRAVKNLEKRFQLNATEVQCVQHVLQLISDSLDAWRTRQYDYYQRVLNGIL